MRTALLVAAAVLQPEAETEIPTRPEEPYSCGVGIAMGGLSGFMSRNFEPKRPDEFYSIQLANPDGGGLFATWSVDNRPPARPRAYGWQFGRPEAQAFRSGPDHVSFPTIRHGRIPDGAIFARLYGDGRHAGTILARRAKETRRLYRLGGDGLSVSLSYLANPEAMAKLASAALWEAVLVDGSGRELGRTSVTVPSPATAEAAFNRGRAELLRHREEFLRRPTWNRDKPCSTWIEELDAPI